MLYIMHNSDVVSVELTLHWRHCDQNMPELHCAPGPLSPDEAQNTSVELRAKKEWSHRIIENSLCAPRCAPLRPVGGLFLATDLLRIWTTDVAELATGGALTAALLPNESARLAAALVMAY